MNPQTDKPPPHVATLPKAMPVPFPCTAKEGDFLSPPLAFPENNP